MSKLIKILLALVVIILIAGISTAFWLFSQFSAPQQNAETDRIVINLGTTQSQLISKLKAQGYIKSEWAFGYVLNNKGWNNKIQSGAYQISKSMDAWRIADILVNHPSEKWIVIPEGLRKEEIADMLQEKLNLPVGVKQEFLDNGKEGYLFPDTYLLNLNYGGKQIVQRMTNQFNEKAADVFKAATKGNIRNDTLVTLASLIQREAANEKEMPIVAGVIWNRLEQKMPLQIDATVQYVLGKEGNWWPKITPADYKIDSPYNTYTNKGKPAGPICNPGLVALNAVVNSQDSDYLYYIHDSDGQIHLAKTYQEQLDNIDKYLK
jgi:UPF0755 protein